MAVAPILVSTPAALAQAEDVVSPAAAEAVARLPDESVSAFLTRVIDAIAAETLVEETLALEVAALVAADPDTLADIIAFAADNPAAAEDVGDGLALAYNAAMAAGDLALAASIWSLATAGTAPLELASAFQVSAIQTAAAPVGAPAGAPVGGGGGDIGGAGGAAGAGTTTGGTTAFGTEGATQAGGAGGISGGSAFSIGNTTFDEDVSPATNL